MCPKVVYLFQPLYNLKDYRAHLRSGKYAVQTFQTMGLVRVGKALTFFWFALLKPTFPIIVQKPAGCGHFQAIPSPNQMILQKLLPRQAEIG